MRLRRTVVTALFAALLCVLAPVSVNFWVLPVSLGTFCVCLLALLTDRRCALMGIILYVALGAVGLPVFAGFTGGAHVLTGPTGGYLFGYIPLAFVISLVCDKRHSLPRMALGMVLGHLICYGLGALWYAIHTDTPILTALLVGVLPFIPFDLVKMTAAGVLAKLLRPRMEKLIRFSENGDRER